MAFVVLGMLFNVLLCTDQNSGGNRGDLVVITPSVSNDVFPMYVFSKYLKKGDMEIGADDRIAMRPSATSAGQRNAKAYVWRNAF